MLDSITLHNFRQFDEKSVVFGPGNTSLRGANEGGKSTIIEGFLYLLGGSKACRNSDFPRWGTKPSACKVEALMTLQGTQIRAVRGKSGAEIYVPANALAPTVTGQNEVTNWFSEQLGAPLDVMAKMCVAGQKEIGGLLDEKNGQVVEFIEDMSGLDIVEFFITRIQATGRVGDTKVLVERASADRAQLQSQQGISYAQAIVDAEAAIGPMEIDAAALKELVDADEASLKTDRAALQKVTTYAANLANAHVRVRTTKENLGCAESALETAEKALGAARAESAIESDLEAAHERQRNVDDLAARRKARSAADAWPAPEAEWDEGVETLQSFVTTNRKLEQEASEKIRALESDLGKLRQSIAVAESKKTTSGACGLCGKDVSELPQVKKQNAGLDAEIAAYAEQVASGVVLVADLQAHRAEAKENAEAGDAILKAPEFHLALSRADLFEVDHKYVPFRFKWIGGEIPAEGTDEKAAISALKSERTERTNLDKARASAASAASSARVALDTANTELFKLQEQAPADNEESLTAKIATRDQSLTEKRLRAFKLAEDLGSKRSLLSGLKQSEATHTDLLQRLATALEKTEQDLAQYEFHNKLVEDLRKARPAVANQLWNMILKSVSTYLSRMRGEPSIVERVEKSFTINGRPSSSYSGSALDLLALGIRIALAKVFVPGADMLVLDEPFAACDADRTLQCLSFAAAAGFGQTIIVTHEPLSEGLADNLVEV
jgi:DNA-binding Xre family transcriptional regulator